MAGGGVNGGMESGELGFGSALGAFAGLAITPGFDNSQLQAVADKLDELITALRR